MKKTLQEIADYVGGRVAGPEGAGDIVIHGLDNIEGAGEHDLTFAVEPHIEAAKTCQAAAVMLPEGTEDFPKPALYVKEPRAAFARLLEHFTPKLQFPAGVSPEAHIGKDVKLGKNVTILPCAVVDDHAVIGDNVTLYPHVYVGQYVEIGDDTLVYANVSIREHCHIGKRCVINCNAVIGSDGFGFTTADGVHTKVPLIVAQTGISGSTKVGHIVTFGGQVGTVGHIEIGANSVYAARSGIIGNMPEGVFCAGFPVQPHTEWLRMQAMMKRLPEMYKKMKLLEKKLAQYEKKN